MKNLKTKTVLIGILFSGSVFAAWQPAQKLVWPWGAPTVPASCSCSIYGVLSGCSPTFYKCVNR